MDGLYYQPHKGRKREYEFIQSLIKEFKIPPERVFAYPMHFSVEYADLSLLTSEVIEGIKIGNLTSKRKEKLLCELAKLPTEIKVWKKGFKISCDVTVIINAKPYYYEFHEEQHWRITDSRPKKIYDINGNIIITPRFLQRFLRDYWRLQYIKDFKIVYKV